MESDEGFQNRWELSGGFHNTQNNARVQNHHYYGAGKSNIDTWSTLVLILMVNTEKGQIATKPTSTVPFLRDPNFVERSEFHQLEEKLRAGRSRVALTGLGGVGYE